MGQFAAVIVPQYCGAPAEKLEVLEWAIALKALETAEQSHPFRTCHHGVDGALLPGGGSHQLHFGNWVQAVEHPPGDISLFPKLPRSLSIESSIGKGGTSQSVPTGPAGTAASGASLGLSSPRMPRDVLSTVLIQSRDWELTSGAKSFMMPCKVPA